MTSGELLARPAVDETWKYRVPESLADLVHLFENRIAVHRLWAEWLEQDTEETQRVAASGIGAAKAHWDYVAQYEAAKNLVSTELDRRESLEARLKEAESALLPFATVPYTQNTFNRAALSDDDFRCARSFLETLEKKYG